MSKCKLQRDIRTTKIYRRKNYSRKIARRDKLSGSRFLMELLFFTWRNWRGISLYTVLLHAAAIPKDKCIIHLSLVIRCKFLPFHSKLPFKFLFLHIQTQLQVFLLFLFIQTSVRSRLNSSLSRAASPSASWRRPAVDSSRPFASANSTRRASFPLAGWIDWPQPPPFSDAVDFQSLGAERRRSSYSLRSAAAE